MGPMKNTRSLAWLIIATLFGAYLFLTPSGALRLAVAASGHFGNALTLRVADREGPDEKGTIYYTLQEPPVDKDTGESLEVWCIQKSGMFYFGEVSGTEDIPVA